MGERVEESAIESKVATERSLSDAWIVGSDGSTGAEHAVSWALTHAVGRAPSLHVLRAWHLPPIAGVEFGVGPLDDMEPPEAHPGLGELAADAVHAGLSVTSEVRYGGAARLLLDTSEDAALLVVGSRGHGGFTGLLLGSVGHEVVVGARCPVMVVPRRAHPEHTT